MDPDDVRLDLDLSTRIAALEARAPVAHRPPVLPGKRRRGRFAISTAMAGVLVLVVVATSAAGAAIISNLATGHPGIQNPGQPLAGAHMECMTPPEAAAFLAGHGFTNVDWQVESGDPTTTGGKGTTTTVHRSSPPAHGFVVPGSILDDGQVIMVIDQRVGATGVGDCFGHRMP
jgi:hypothetical protein